MHPGFGVSGAEGLEGTDLNWLHRDKLGRLVETRNFLPRLVRSDSIADEQTNGGTDPLEEMLRITETRPNTGRKMRLAGVREKALRTDGWTDGHTLL